MIHCCLLTMNLTVLCGLKLVKYTQPTYRTILLVVERCGCTNTDAVFMSVVKCILDACMKNYY